MKKRLGIITKSDIFYNKARLLLRERADVVRIARADIEDGKYDAIFTDDAELKAGGADVIHFGIGGDFPLPCRHEELFCALDVGHRKDPPPLYLDGKCAYLYGKRIELTSTETRLLGILLKEAKGVTSFRIMELMADKCFSYNSLKVYINFLRKKLESDGDKIIFSSRIPGGCLYTIHEKYRRTLYADDK